MTSNKKLKTLSEKIVRTFRINGLCKILNCLLFMFLFSSCAHKRRVTKIIRATITASLIRYHFPVIPKTMHISNFFSEEKVIKTYFLSVCEVCTNNCRTPCIYIAQWNPSKVFRALRYFLSHLGADLIKVLKIFNFFFSSLNHSIKTLKNILQKIKMQYVL